MAESLNLYQRIHAVMTDLDYIQKDPKKAGLQFSYASHDKVTAAVREVCVKHGLICLPSVQSFTQDGNRTEIYLATKLINIENPDEYEVIHSVGYGVDPQDKGPGKGVSYAFKYALLKAFMLETGDDPDADQGKEYDHKKGPVATGGSIPVQSAEKPMDKYARLVKEAAKLDKTRDENWLREEAKKNSCKTIGEAIKWTENYINKVKETTGKE